MHRHTYSAHQITTFLCLIKVIKVILSIFIEQLWFHLPTPPTRFHLHTHTPSAHSYWTTHLKSHLASFPWLRIYPLWAERSVFRTNKIEVCFDMQLLIMLRVWHPSLYAFPEFNHHYQIWNHLKCLACLKYRQTEVRLSNHITVSNYPWSTLRLF